MKKKALAALLSLALLLALPLPASAAEANTQIYCTFSGIRTEAPPIVQAPAQPSYVVNIPATYDTNTTGFFFLTNTEKPKYKALCNLHRSSTYGVTGEWIGSPDRTLAAAFEDGNTTPVSFGYIVASATADDTTIDGTYTGTLYFKIEVQDAP